MKEMIILAQEIIDGRRLGAQDDYTYFLDAPLEELQQGADAIRRALCGDKVNLCTIINGRSGRCSENCKYCAQAGCYQTKIEEYPMLTPEEVIEDGKKRERDGVHRYSIVTAGRGLHGEDFAMACDAYRRLKEETGLELCASHGLLSEEEVRQLKETGVSNYHCNIETSRRFFPEICTTHTFDDNIEQIRRAQKAGLHICSGGIIGMGETFEDRVDMALTLQELGVKSIPINVLVPIPGTPLADMPLLGQEEILRTITMFRYVNPDAYIRMAAGRNRFPSGGRALFQSGCNATITGDMLTTTGNNTAMDKEMLAGLGFTM